MPGACNSRQSRAESTEGGAGLRPDAIADIKPLHSPAVAWVDWAVLGSALINGGALAAGRMIGTLSTLLVQLALAIWAVMPFDAGLVLADLNVGLLYVFAVSSMGVYGIIMSGWASNSKYPFLGGLRSAAQMVSYEVSMGFILVAVMLYAQSLNLSDIVMAQQGNVLGILNGNIFNPLLFPAGVMYFITALA
jgi:NADH-quinone oxidoreductase subunit H